MSGPTLGLAMIMQNDKVHIPVAISQFYYVVSDIFVVDGGSVDDSVGWAKRMGARVETRRFSGNFSEQKNYAISGLATDWVYLHDPDERLEPTLLEILPMLISEEGQTFLMEANVIPPCKSFFDCFGIPRKNFIDGVQTPIYPDYQYRLFRNYCRFEGSVHEKITGFKNRTEVDYTRPNKARPKEKDKLGITAIDTDRGQVEPGVNIYDSEQWSRFNLLHYKSAVKQADQDKLYRSIRERETHE